MIRPITVLTFILACGSGMYLYQAKHRVHLLDQQIDQTVKQTDTVREQSRALHAEWMLLNDPDRLHRLAAQYLTDLQPVAPTQFTGLADLDSRLPPVAPPPPAATATVVASAATSAPVPDHASSEASGRGRDGGTDQVKVDVLPNRPTARAAARLGNVASARVAAPPPTADHAPQPVIAAAPQADRAPRPGIAQASQVDRAPRPVIAQAPQVDRAPRPVIAEAPPTDRAPRPVIAQAPRSTARVTDLSPVRPHPIVASVRTAQHVPPWRPAPRHAMIAEGVPSRFIRSEQRPMAFARPQTAPPAAYGGSMLGMARGTSNLPRPVPLNADYSNSGG